MSLGTGDEGLRCVRKDRSATSLVSASDGMAWAGPTLCPDGCGRRCSCLG